MGGTSNIYLGAMGLSFLIILVVAVVLYILSPNDFNRECMDRHNFYRDKHWVAPLFLKKELIDMAEKRAQEIKTTNDFGHSTDNRFGENLYMKTFTVDTPGALDGVKCEDGIKLWYDEIQNWDFNRSRPKISADSNEQQKGVRHFTQLVWDDTRNVGCAKSYNEKSFTAYIVCNYDPKGNIKGGYKKHVIPPK